MAEFAATIETLENHLMRAWMRADAAEIRKHLSRDFLMITGAARPELLDRPSFVEAAPKHFRCNAFRFREVHVRRHGKTAWFVAGCDMELSVGGREWTGEFWLTDLWRKSRMRRSWQLIERSLSRVEEDRQLSDAVRSLQLWA